MMQRALEDRKYFSDSIQTGEIQNLSTEEIESLLKAHDCDGSLRDAVIERKMKEIERKIKEFSSPSTDTQSATFEPSALEQLKLKPSAEITLLDVAVIMNLQLSGHDLVAYINSNIRLVRYYWQTCYANIDSWYGNIDNWFDIIVSHPDYFKDNLLPKVGNWPLERIIELAKVNIYFFRQLWPMLSNIKNLSGKVQDELSTQYPAEFPAQLKDAVYAYRLLKDPGFTNGISLKQFKHFAQLAQLTHKELIAYLSEHQALAQEMYFAAEDRFGWEDWITISANNPIIIKNLIGSHDISCTPQIILKLAKVDLWVAKYLTDLKLINTLSSEEIAEINNFYSDADLAKQLTAILEKRGYRSMPAKPSRSLLSTYTAEYIEYYVIYLKRYCHRSVDLYRYLNQADNKPLAVLLWNHAEHRQLLTQWDWTFLAMNNIQLAVSIRAAECKNWHKFNLNCLARLSEKTAVEILSDAETGAKLTRADLLELFKMYSAEKIHDLILSHADLLAKLHMAVAGQGEMSFESLARYFLAEGYPKQALACLKKGVTVYSDTAGLYNFVLEMENVSSADLHFFLNQVKQAIQENVIPSQRSQLMVIEKLLQAKLLVLTGDDEYKSATQRQFEEEEAELIEQDKLRAKEERYIKDICNGLYHAAANIPEDEKTAFTLFGIEEFKSDTSMLILKSSDALPVACYNLTNTIIAYIRANDISAAISISAAAKDIFEKNIQLREYIEKTYPDFYRQMQLQFPTYKNGHTTFTRNTTISILPLTIANITASRSEGNNRIGNDSL